ncbi:MAG: cold shock domain-containing protein [Coleofasciculaceae cyanobacterium]
MKPSLRKGILTTWKDDRGFGFIKNIDGNKDIYLHISQLKGMNRRPKVGDTIIYELKTETDGKLRAANAAIEGVVPQPLSKYQQRKQNRFLQTVIGIPVMTFVALISMIFNGGYSQESRNNRSTPSQVSPTTSTPKIACNIKGNVSISTGAKLYHLPGMEDYENTRIESKHGERWFCTEQEARAAGWRKAPR